MIDNKIYYTIGDILRDVFIPANNSLNGKTVPIVDVLNLVYDPNSHALKINVSGLDSVLQNVAGLGDLSNTFFTVKISDGGPFDGKAIAEKGYTINQLTFEMNISNLSTDPYFSFSNLTMNTNPLVLDSNDAALSIDTLTQPLTSTNIGTGFSIDILYGDSGQYSDSKNATIQFGQKAFYGYSPKATLTTTNITSLNSTEIENNLSAGITVIYGFNLAPNYMYFCYPTEWGDITKLKSNTGDLSSISDWENIGVTAITNVYGVIDNYNVYKTIYKNSSSNLVMTFS